jgi:hypothetical protein
MPTATSLPRSRMRFTLGECLAAAVRGMALAALMAAGLGLLLVILARCSSPRWGPGS